MRQLEKRYLKSERIVLKARFSAWVFLREVVIGALLGGALAAVWLNAGGIEKLLFKHETVRYLTDANMRWALLAAGALLLTLLLFEALSLYFKEMVVLEDRLVYRRGIFFSNTVSVPLGKIKLIMTNGNPLYRLLGIGNITIVADGLMPVVLKRVRAADRLAKRILVEAKKTSGSNMRLVLAPAKKK